MAKLRKKLAKVHREFDFVEVLWDDALGETGWLDHKDPAKPALCITRGWLVKDEPDRIALTMTFGVDQEGQSMHSVLVLPRGMVRSVTVMNKGATAVKAKKPKKYKIGFM